MPDGLAVGERHDGPGAMEATTGRESPCATRCARVRPDRGRLGESRLHGTKERHRQRWQAEFRDEQQRGRSCFDGSRWAVLSSVQEVRLRIWGGGLHLSRSGDFPLTELAAGARWTGRLLGLFRRASRAVVLTFAGARGGRRYWYRVLGEADSGRRLARHSAIR